MNRTALPFALLALMCLNAAISAQDMTTKNPKVPGPKDTVIVARVQISPAPNYAFFASYSEASKEAFVPYAEFECWLNRASSDASWPVRLLKQVAEEKCALGKMAGYRIQSIGYDQAFSFTFFASLANCGDIVARFSPGKALRFAEGSRFVYAGTFIFDVDGVTLEAKSVQVRDEFDAAKAFVSERYGAAAADSLVRGTLVDPRK